MVTFQETEMERMDSPMYWIPYASGNFLHLHQVSKGHISTSFAKPKYLHFVTKRAVWDSLATPRKLPVTVQNAKDRGRELHCAKPFWISVQLGQSFKILWMNQHDATYLAASNCFAHVKSFDLEAQKVTKMPKSVP